MHRARWLLLTGLCAAACGGGSSSGGDGGSGASAGTGASSNGGSSSGGTATSGSCTAQVQTGTRTECDFSQGISDPDIACDDVPVYGNVPGAMCSGSCVDPKTTNAHCGECGNACDSGQYCSDGECTPYGNGGSAAGGGGVGGNGATSGSGATSGAGGGAPQQPDLTVTNFSLSRTVDASGECANGICSHDVRVCLDILKNNVVEISNLGFGPSPAVTVAIGFEDAGQELHPCAMEAPLVSPPLASLEKWTKSDAFCCTANLRLPGQYRLSVIADPDDEIAEYDENNNAGYTDLATISAP